MGAPVRLAKSSASLNDVTALYVSVRALVAKKDYAAALDSGWQLYDLLCGTTPRRKAAPQSGMNGAHPQLAEPPQDAESQRWAKVVVGAVLSLLMSAVESLPAPQLSVTLGALLQPLMALLAWLRLLSDADEQQYGDAICHSLIKATGQLAESGTAASERMRECAELTVRFSATVQPADRAAAVLRKLAGLLSTHDAVQLATRGIGVLEQHGKALADDQLLRLLEQLAGRPCSSSEAMDMTSLFHSCTGDRVAGGAGILAAAVSYPSSGGSATGDWAQRLSEAAASVRRLAESPAGAAAPGAQPQPQQLACLTVTLRAVGALRKALPEGAMAAALPPEAAGAASAALQTAGCLLAAAMRLESGASDVGQRYGQLVGRALCAVASLRSRFPDSGAAEESVCRTEDFTCLLPDVLSRSGGGPSPLNQQELLWLSASMYNLGIGLVEGGRPAAGAGPLAVAANAALAATGAAAGELDSQGVAGVNKRLASLARCQQQCGRAIEAACAVGCAVVALAPASAADPSLLLPLLRTFVVARLAALAAAEAAPAAAAPKARGGRRAHAPPQQPAAPGDVPTLVAMLEDAEGMLAAAAAALLEEEAAVLCDIASACRDDVVQRELGDRMEALQQHASAGGRSRLLVLQARLLQRSGAVQSGATSAGEQDPPALLRAALDVAAEAGDSAAGAQAAAHCMLALQEAAAVLAAHHDAPCEPRHWRQAHAHSQQAAAAWEACLAAAEPGRGGNGGEGDAGGRCRLSWSHAGPCGAEAADLAALSGLQGLADIERRLRAVASELQQQRPDWDGDDCSSAVTSPSCALCLVTSPPSSAASGGAVDEGPAAAAGSDSSGRQPTLQRIILHQGAAEAALQAGECDIVAAQHDAHEALRLVAGLHASLEAVGAAGPPTEDAHRLQGVTFWRLQELRLASLLQTGRLMEMSSSPEEALWSFQEAHTLADTIGSAAIAALCQALAAEVHGRRGESEAAANALQQATDAADGLESSCDLAAAAIRARLALADACCRRWRGDAAGALARCGAGLAALEACSSGGDGGSGGDACCGGGAARFAPWAAADVALRLRLQQAKCHHLLGDADAAAEALAGLHDAMGSMPIQHPVQAAAAAIFSASIAPLPACGSQDDQGVVFLGVSGNPCAESCPKEASRKHGSRKQAGSAGSGRKAPAPAVGLDSLLAAHAQCRHVPLLRRKAAGLVAGAAAAAGLPHAALLYSHDALGTALQHQYATVLDSKRRSLRRRMPAGAAEPEATKSLAAIQGALQLVDVRSLGAKPAALEAEAQHALERAAASLGGADSVHCSLSLEPAAVAHPNAAASAAAPSRLVISRYVAGRPPLLVAVPLRQLAAAADEQQDVAAVLADILAASDASLRPGLALETPAAKCGWWDTRIALDGRLAALLARLDASWLGPWRCLLFGQPTDAGLAASLAHAGAWLVQQVAQLPPAAHVTSGSSSSSTTTCGDGGRSRSPAAQLLRPAAAELCLVLALAAGELPVKDAEAVLVQALRLAGRDAGGAAGLAADLWRRCTDVVGSHTAAQAEALAAGLAALTLGRPGSCSLTFRERMEAEEAAFLGTVEMARSAADAPATRQSQRRRPPRRAADADAQPEQQSPAQAAAPRSSARGRPWRGAAASQTLADISNAEEPPATPAPAAAPAAAKANARPQLATPATAAPARRSRLAGMAGAPMTAAPALRLRRIAAEEEESEDSEQMESRATPLLAVLPSGVKPAKTKAAAATKQAAPTTARTSRAAAAAPGHGKQRGKREAGDGGGESSGLPRIERRPTLLVLAGALLPLPLESCPSLRHLRIYRMPSLAAACAVAERRRQAEGGGIGIGGGGGGGGAALDLASTFYMLNPSGDLAATQAAFEERFSSQAGWEGTSGSAPEAADLAAALQEHQVFVYLGHGGGEQYLPRRALARLPRCAGALLMGCSSGRLRAHGAYDPSGTVLAYLLAGCPTAVANLWDVTDVDIDRFARGVLDQWLGDEQSEDGPLRREAPPSRRSGARGTATAAEASRAAAGAAGSSYGGGGELCIAASVAAARGVCRLRHLIGAAPVCYGVPTKVQRP